MLSLLVLLPVYLLETYVEPFRQGFFCNDQSLMKPNRKSFMSTTVIGVLGLCVPILIIVILESLSIRLKMTQDEWQYCQIRKFSGDKRQDVWKTVQSSWRVIMIFLLGVDLTLLFTRVSMYSVGRLRPDFLDVCKPSHLAANCSLAYIRENVCTNPDLAAIKHARLSFPSGHASWSVYCAGYLTAYLQAKLSLTWSWWPKVLTQVVLLMAACLACLSRLVDNKHHSSDVIAGALLGLAVCASMVMYTSQFRHIATLKSSYNFELTGKVPDSTEVSIIVKGLKTKSDLQDVAQEVKAIFETA